MRKRRGVEDRLQARIVSYADDYVICCKGGVDEALAEMREMMRRLKLTINEAKTRVCHLPEERFDFLGYTFGRYYSPQTGRAYLCPWPSKRSVQRLIGAIREATERRTQWQEAERSYVRSTASSSGGPTTSVSARPGKPTGRSTSTRRVGYAGGYAESTR
ncbi:MAG TPA: reverse transcriptase domain-containing protein [Steroidobacteraceae bacterium]|nr:reverse transcriptase domain-containing protein [Steroidobacteraceae bacterium]